MRSRGQLWSLDVVLAAVVFTLAIGIILGQSELQIFYGQQDRITHERVQMALFASNGVASKPDVFFGNENIRCGPNFAGSTIYGWASDNELSSLENCLVDSSAPFTPDAFGLPAPYLLSLSSFIPTHFSGSPAVPSTLDAYAKIPRRVLIFDAQSQVDAFKLRQCLDGGCNSEMATLTATVWRP